MRCIVSDREGNEIKTWRCVVRFLMCTPPWFHYHNHLKLAKYFTHTVHLPGTVLSLLYTHSDNSQLLQHRSERRAHGTQLSLRWHGLWPNHYMLGRVVSEDKCTNCNFMSTAYRHSLYITTS